MEDKILGFMAQIVSAYITNSDVTMQQLPVLINAVHQTLATAGQAAGDLEKLKPMVAAEGSVFGDHIVCLGCGDSFKMLKRHLKAGHQMTPETYRQRWQLPSSYSMVAADYAMTRSKLAIDSGLGRKSVAFSKPPATRTVRGRAKNVFSY